MIIIIGVYILVSLWSQQFIRDGVQATGKLDEIIQLPMRKKDVSYYLGTKPEISSRRLADFEADGIIKQQGQR